MEYFITAGKKLEHFDSEQMRKLTHTITIDPGQLFANIKFECGLEVRVHHKKSKERKRRS